jgi:hypothetical protein
MRFCNAGVYIAQHKSKINSMGCDRFWRIKISVFLGRGLAKAATFLNHKKLKI